MRQNYIYGDLVMTNGKPIGTLKGVPYKVISNDPTNTHDFEEKHYEGSVVLDSIEDCKLGDKGFLFASSSAWVKDIVPISLTEEILVKNGFIFDDNKLIYYKAYNCNNEEEDAVSIQIWRTTESKFEMNCNGTYINRIKYIHQLQHFLFGCGCHIKFRI